jgi:8-oxo-dGTP diphosphatase
LCEIDTLKKARTYDSIPTYPLATDCAVFGFDGVQLQLLLIQREKEPFAGEWALPGGFVFDDETAEESAARILHEKTDISDLYIEQLKSYSALDRDPRQRVVAIAYFALVNSSQFTVMAGRNTINVKWFPMGALPKLAFDHEQIAEDAFTRLRGKIRYQPIGFQLLDELFTLSQLQQLYEAILGQTIDKRNFRKKILETGLLMQTDQKEQNVPRRAAAYYRFDRNKYAELTVSGFNFEL